MPFQNIFDLASLHQPLQNDSIFVGSEHTVFTECRSRKLLTVRLLILFLSDSSCYIFLLLFGGILARLIEVLRLVAHSLIRVAVQEQLYCDFALCKIPS